MNSKEIEIWTLIRLAIIEGTANQNSREQHSTSFIELLKRLMEGT